MIVMDVLGIIEGAVPAVGWVVNDIGSCGTKTIVKEVVSKINPEDIGTIKKIGLNVSKKYILPAVGGHIVVKELKEMTKETTNKVKVAKKFISKKLGTDSEESTTYEVIAVKAEIVEEN